MDPDQQTPNFINPAYATPEQIKQMREMAAQLQTGAIAPESAKHWTGALAQALMGLQANSKVNQANQLQRQLLQQGQQGLQQAGQVNPYVRQLLGMGGQPSPQAMPPQQAPTSMPGQSVPMQPGNMPVGDPSTAPRSEIPSTPKVWGDKEAIAAGLYDDPAAIPKNARPMQFQGQGGQPQGGDLSAFFMNPSIPKELKDQVKEGLTPKPVEDVYGRPAARMGTMGPTVGLPTQNFTPGFRAPATVGPDGGISTTIANPAPGAGGGQSTRGQLDNLFQTGQDFARESTVNKTARTGLEQDFTSANLVPQTRQILATMKDDILSHGDKMTFGPTADWVNNLKRGIAQHAPGLMSDADMQGLASADSFDKLSAQLQSIVGRQVGGTDASLMQGMRSVPGQHNSKEGALALIDMLDQVSQQQAKFAIQNMSKVGQPGFNYLDAKNKFFEANPIVNPLTHNALRMDLSNRGNPPAKTKTGDWGIVR